MDDSTKRLIEEMMKQQHEKEQQSSPYLSFLSKNNFSSTQKPKKKDTTSSLTSKWNLNSYKDIKNYLIMQSKNMRNRIKEITDGLKMPEKTSVRLGSGKKMMASILYFDLENFTSRSSEIGNKMTLYVLNLVIPTIIRITRRWDGEIEKNTGDGIMAIFGTETRNNFIIARDAIEVALTIKYFMLNEVNPLLEEKGIAGFNFRIGIDMGEVLLANIGMINNSFITTVGNAANIANKLQELAEINSVYIGNNLFNNMGEKIKHYCIEKTDSSWRWKYSTGESYKFYEFTFNWLTPRDWMREFKYYK